MKNLKNFIYALLTLYVVSSVLLILFSERLLGLFNARDDASFWGLWLAVGLVLLVVEVLTEKGHVAQLERRVKRLQQEINEVKARYYDDLSTSGKAPERPVPLVKITPVRP